MSLRSRVSAIAAALALTAASPGEPERVLPPPSDPAWEALELPGVARPTRYRAVVVAGVPALLGEARCGASGRVLPVPGLDLEATPVLHWRWRAEQLPEAFDERVRAGDDFAVRVSVLFRFEPERAGWIDRVRNDLMGRLVGRQIPGSALHFVWTVAVPPGTVWPNPRTDKAVNWALERGPASDWHEAAVDVGAAYRAAFDREPPTPLGVAVMTDSDDHCGETRGLYADFRFGPAQRQEVSGIPGPAPASSGPVESPPPAAAPPAPTGIPSVRP